MSKTYRALTIVTIVATLASLVAAFTFEPGRGGWFSYAPLNPGAQFQGLLAVAANGAWQTTATMAAPIVAMFGAVAAQARRWRWLVALTLLGLLGVYGPALLSALGPIIDSAVSFHAMGLVESVYMHALPLVLLAIAALIFVATTSRPARMHSDQASEAAA